MTVEIVVDELVVRGVAPADARELAAALEARLAALGADAGRVTAWSEAVRRLPALSAPAGAPGELGEELAAALWRALVEGDGR